MSIKKNVLLKVVSTYRQFPYLPTVPTVVGRYGTGKKIYFVGRYGVSGT